MLACVVTLRFDPLIEALDDSPLGEFLKGIIYERARLTAG